MINLTRLLERELLGVRDFLSSINPNEGFSSEGFSGQNNCYRKVPVDFERDVFYNVDIKKVDEDYSI